MRGDMGPLYDAHAERMLAHCWSLLGDGAAVDAVQDAFLAALRHPPRGDRVLWLHALSRSACAERDAFAGFRPVYNPVHPATADPLLRAFGELRPDHREALVLHAGEWLEVADIARVLGIAPDTVLGLLHAARTRLERTVVDQLMRGLPGDHRDVITAFEKGRLPHLLARRVPEPPPWLRDRILAACAEALADPATRPLTEITSPSPLVVIGSEVAAPPGRAGRAGGPGRRQGGRTRGFGAVAGMAASVAAAIGLLVTWPSAKGDGVNAIAPSSGSSPTGTPADPSAPGTSPASAPERDGTPTPPAPSPATQQQTPTSAVPPATMSGGAPSSPGSPAAPAPRQPSQTTPGGPDRTTSPPQTSPAPQDPSGSPSPTDPGTPDDPGTGDPSTPPGSPGPSDPSQPPSDPPDPSPGPEPSPTANPTPSPSAGR